MIPEQYQSWSFVSSLPEERSDFKITAFLSFPLSGWLPTFYLSLEELPSGQGKKYPHLILAVLYIFYDSLKNVRSQPVSSSTTQFSEQQLSLGNSETLPCPILTSSRLFPQHWKEWPIKPIFILHFVNISVFHCFKQLLDEHILVFIMILKSNLSFCKCTSNKYDSDSWCGPRLHVPFRSCLLWN